MAEDPKTPASPAVPGLPAEPEQDSLFRLQVNVQEFVFRNAKYAAGAVGVVLASAFVWGLWDSWRTSQAEEDFAAIAEIDFRMPKPDPMSRSGMVPKDDPTDTARMATLAEGARRYRGAAAEATGTAAVVAYLDAAEAWQRAGKPEEALIDLKAAWDLGQKDLPGFSAASNYARALADANRADDAILILRESVAREEGVFAEEALLLLAAAQLDAGKTEDARGVLTEFATRFPDSLRGPRLAELRSRAGG